MKKIALVLGLVAAALFVAPVLESAVSPTVVFQAVGTASDSGGGGGW